MLLVSQPDVMATSSWPLAQEPPCASTALGFHGTFLDTAFFFWPKIGVFWLWWTEGNNSGVQDNACRSVLRCSLGHGFHCEKGKGTHPPAQGAGTFFFPPYGTGLPTALRKSHPLGTRHFWA